MQLPTHWASGESFSTPNGIVVEFFAVSWGPRANTIFVKWEKKAKKRRKEKIHKINIKNNHGRSSISEISSYFVNLPSHTLQIPALFVAGTHLREVGPPTFFFQNFCLCKLFENRLREKKIV